ncbi:MAG: hypothetical protein AAB254_06080 [candidate division NC10 bacterium]
MAETPSNPSQLKSIGEKFGVQYPPEFIAHVCGAFPGVYVEVKESVWPRAKAYDVGPFWSFLYALHTYTPAPDSEPWMRLADAAASFQKETGLKAGPVLKILGDADVYCVDPNGNLVRFSHEENTLKPVHLTFWQLLDREVGALAERKARKQGAV